MDEKLITKSVEELKQAERKFTQSFDMIFALKGLNLKNPDDQVEFFLQVHKTLGKKRKVCALVGPELVDDARKIFDKTVTVDEFPKLGKKEIKKLADEHDFFIGQANIMPKIAQTFGRTLGPRGKMPNPKSGAVVPPKAPLADVYERFQRTVKISAKRSPSIQVMVGTQAMESADIIDNIKTVYDQVIHHLPQERNNIKHVFLKLTMGKPVKLQ